MKADTMTNLYGKFDEFTSDGMLRIVPFEDCPSGRRAYHGNSGPRDSVRFDGRDWLVKYPKNTREYEGKNLLSYTTSPVSEWLGSHIYASLGIPVHETILVARRGKVAVACADFRSGIDLNRFEFQEFQQVLNTDPTERILPDGSNGSGESVFLDDVLRAIRTLPALRETPGTIERFWDMFVVDAILDNIDRNNRNWGIFAAQDDNEHNFLAPVYDNGNAFNNKSAGPRFSTSLNEPKRLFGDAIPNVRSIYKTTDSKSVHPFKYLERTQDEDAIRAVGRVLAHIDLDIIYELIDRIPYEFGGYVLMPEEAHEFYKKVIEIRVRTGLVPVAIKHGQRLPEALTPDAPAILDAPVPEDENSPEYAVWLSRHELAKPGSVGSGPKH